MPAVPDVFPRGKSLAETDTITGDGWFVNQYVHGQRTRRINFYYSGGNRALGVEVMKTLGKYRLLRELGRGGMGVVYLAEDARLLREVALKVLHPALTLDRDFVARFAGEARAIAALTHPGIVRVHAFEEVDGSHLIDMEFIDGRSLHQILSKGPVSRPHALNVITRVLEALAACHARRMVHRDIKPSNILIAYDGRVFLSDFGLALSNVHVAAANTSSCFIGTPKYAPPESWDRAKPAPPGDVYSAGLVLLELLAGKTPFDGDSPLEIMRKAVAAADVPVRDLIPDASKGLVDLIADMLAANPADRPADAGEALRRLRETAECAELPDDGAETLRITPPKFRYRRPRSVKRAMRVLAATVAVAFIVVAAIFVWRQREVPEAPTGLAGVQRDATAPPAATPAIEPITSSNVANVLAAGSRVIFVANAGDWRSLWGYNTATGEAAPLWPALRLGPGDDIHGAHKVAGGIVSLLRTHTGGLTLFRTDGTPGGTAPLAFAASRAANRLAMLGAHEGKAWFNRMSGDGTFGLWETDGSLAGTRHVWGDGGDGLVDFLRVTPGGTLYFGGEHAPLQRLYPGARKPEIIREHPDSEFACISVFTLGESVLAVGSMGTSGLELYRVEPDSTVPRLLFEFVLGPSSGLGTTDFMRLGERVAFVATTPEFGAEPWITDGTADGTRLLADVNPGAGASHPNRFTESGGRLYFSAQNAIHGRELWVSDGTPEGTRMLADHAPGVESGNPYAFFPFNNGLLFTPHEAVHGEELWFTDGTPEGTRLFYEFIPGPEGGEPYDLNLIEGKLLFAARHPEHGRVLWESDGTPEGTRPLFQHLEGPPAPTPAPAAWITFKGESFITTTTPEHGAELWATDPATGESRLVRDVYPGRPGSNPRSFFVFQNTLYFVANDGIHGEELWRTDGTEAGTALALDALGGERSGNPRFLTRWGANRFAFTAEIESGYRIVYFDGAVGEFRVPHGPPYAGADWEPVDLRVGPEDRLEFSVRSPSGETTLWWTNGDTPLRMPGLGRAGHTE